MSHPPPPPKNYTYVIVALVVGLVLLLVGATIYTEVTRDSATAPVPTVTVTASPADAPDPENLFVVAYRDRTKDYKAEVADIMLLGNGICEEIDRTQDPMTTAGRLFRDYEPADAGYIVGQAVLILCPRNLDTLPSS